MFLLVAIAGIVLTPQPFAIRLWWLAGLLISIVILGVFAPTVAAALLGWALYVALGLVLAVWALRFLAWFVPRLVEWWASRRAAAIMPFQAGAAWSGADTPPPTENPFGGGSSTDRPGMEGGAAHG